MLKDRATDAALHNSATQCITVATETGVQVFPTGDYGIMLNQATLNTMTGTITSLTGQIGEGNKVGIEVTNSRVTATSNVMISMGTGCQTDSTHNTVSFQNVLVEAGKFTAYFVNTSKDTPCKIPFTFFFFVVN